MSKTITSKQGVTYYNYNDVEDVTDIVSGRKYYKQLVSNCQTYRTKNPACTVKVYWPVYKEVEFVINASNTDYKEVTKDKIPIDIKFTIYNETLEEKLKDQTVEQVQDYLDKFNKEVEIPQQEEFINTTGHIEESDEDLVDTGFLTIFEESNIVTEDIFQVTIKDDVYTEGKPVDTESIIRDTQALEDTTTLMAASTADAEDNSAIVSQEPQERTSKNTFEAAVGIVAAVNDFGQFLQRGTKCPVCGKTVPFMPANGYCSLQCAGRDLLKKLTSCLSGEYEVETPEIITVSLHLYYKLLYMCNILT